MHQKHPPAKVAFSYFLAPASALPASYAVTRAANDDAANNANTKSSAVLFMTIPSRRFSFTLSAMSDYRKLIIYGIRIAGELEFYTGFRKAVS